MMSAKFTSCETVELSKEILIFSKPRPVCWVMEMSDTLPAISLSAKSLLTWLWTRSRLKEWTIVPIYSLEAIATLLETIQIKYTLKNHVAQHEKVLQQSIYWGSLSAKHEVPATQCPEQNWFSRQSSLWKKAIAGDDRGLIHTQFCLTVQLCKYVQTGQFECMLKPLLN